MTYDAVIIGAGHNGLVTGCYLARAGLKVCIVEKNDWVGGAAVSRELYPGFTYSNCSYVASLFRPEIMRDLELPKYGLQILPYEGGAVFMGDGDYLGMFRDHDANRREFARHSRRDAKAYDRDSRDVLRFCRFIRPMLLRTPPDPSSFKPRDLAELMWLGRKMGEMSERQMAETVRFWTMSISDFLDEYFESPVIKGDMAVSAIIGTALGPMSPGSAYVLLHHYMGDVDGNVGAWGYARGGMGAITKALTQSFGASGGEVRAGNGVERIVVRGGRTTGVVLANGDEGKGKADFREFLRMVLINVYDVAQDELTDARLRGLLAFDATLGSWLGPRSPNSLILYLNRLAMGVSPLLPKGGMGALAAALAKAAVAAGKVNL